MKIALILVLFSSSVIGALGNTDKVESVSVMEGDSVTLHTGATKIQGSDSIEWRFNGTRMARIKSDSSSTGGPFRDTMELNNQTGDLKITNVRTTDSGLYKLNIKRSSGSSEMTFSVTVVISGVKSVSVKEGDSVTLNTGVNKQRDDVIQWRHQNLLVAEINYNDIWQLRDRLELNDQTGSLTITNITTEHAGDYEVEISLSSRRYTIHKSFSVNVSETVTLLLVMEGDSVTLHPGVNKIERDDTVQWYWDKNIFITPSPASVEAKWTNTDQNGQTGDLTIRNIRRDQSGDYKVIFMNIQTFFVSLHRKFHINITGVLNADKDPVKKVLGTVGESVTLKTEKQSHEVMKWRFGPQNTVIAELKVSADSFTVYDDVLDGRFRGRLELDDQTGSLTITNTRTEHDGVYEAEIRGSGHTILKTFSVTVTDVKSKSVMEGDSVTLHTGLTQIQRNDVILWRFGDQDIIIAPLNGPDVESGWSNVHLNYQTGDLTISNIRGDQFGDYKVEINTISMISHRKYNISDSGLSPGAVAGIVAVVVLLVFATVGVICYRRKCSKTETHSEVNGQNHTSNRDEETELTKPAEAAE